MSLTARRGVLLLVVALIAFALGRLAVRFALNVLLGGTMFGGNFL